MVGSSDLSLDGAKFAKFARDTGIIDGRKITATDIDIIFNKVKAKGNRRIEWPQFLEAIYMIADKRYPEKIPTQALSCLLYDVCIRSPGGPASSSTVVKNDAVLDRLTDTTGYTGTHKARFDDNGVGRGAAGRDQGSKTDRLDKLVNRDFVGTASLRASGSKRGKVNTASEEQLDIASNAPKKSNPTFRSVYDKDGNVNPTPALSVGNLGRNTTNAGSSSSISKLPVSTKGSTSSVNFAQTGSKGSVFDRLTDSNGYTGSHKHRFTAGGVGRGLAGRDSIPKNGVGVYRGGDVKELSQILRN
ncbi:hypothetical protein HK101_007038 [Irineochytrium annulatum]|nr:hypothetical protein HK101_007038 [Irineochytrium annulatum]